jgi:hypothetical protein
MRSLLAFQLASLAWLYPKINTTSENAPHTSRAAMRQAIAEHPAGGEGWQESQLENVYVLGGKPQSRGVTRLT